MPGWFSGINYRLPERFSPEEARTRRLTHLLERERKALEVEPLRLSPANKFHYQQLRNFELKFKSELEARARVIKRTRLNDPNLKSRANKAAMLRLFQLQQERAVLLQRAASEKRRNYLFSSAIAANRSFFHPFGANPRTVYGTEAKTVVSPTARRMFQNPLKAFPCIQRIVRKEVMFAKGHGGRAHRGRRRFNPLSAIGC